MVAGTKYMKKVWDVETKAYKWVQEGIWIDGTDYSAKEAEEKWNRRFPKTVRHVILLNLLGRYVQEKLSFDATHKFMNQVEEDIVALNHSYVASYLGKGNKKISYESIPERWRQGIQQIAKEATEGYDRGRHSTCPSISQSAHPYREFHLEPSKDGRATTAKHMGMIFIYYSTTHAFATYDYHLVTFPFKLGKKNIEVPLVGGARDTLIKWPWD
jgi:hypothetical protein